ncbi:MAG: hypothetical protein KatS3mg065_1010 [Chloroflexota bacterium]|nr:MAG: hypothetical protein KatS3mg065_1010 [Chloroflexota bacterium]
MPQLGRSAASGAGLVLGLVSALANPGLVLAHGPVPAEPPTPVNLALDWSFDPWIWIPLLAAGLFWRWAVRRVNAAHPTNPVPAHRTWAFVGGLVAVAVALQSGIERYDTSLFWIHMIQHLLLTMVAAPLLALSGPVTLLLRVASPDDRRRWILPVLHSRAVRIVAHPVVAWLVFAGVAWGTHFSPLYNAALEDRLVHDLEHALLFGSGLLFWWPAAGVDPTPWRLSYPARLLYVGLQMPQNTFLSLAIYSASEPLYPHYATLVRPWGPTPLADQQLGGGIMWVAGDLMFLVVALVLLWAWMEAEGRATARSDARAEVERAAIRARELALADRRAGGDWGVGVEPEPTARDVRPGGEGGSASLGDRSRRTGRPAAAARRGVLGSGPGRRCPPETTATTVPLRRSIPSSRAR